MRKKNRLSAPGSRMCLVGIGWLSLSDVRAKYWYIGLQRALGWHGARSLVLVSFRDYGEYFLVSRSWLSHWRRTTTTLASASLSRHSRSIDPTWLAHALTVCLWLGLAVTCTVIICTICNSDTRRSPTKIRLSHRRDWAPFCLQGFNTHIRESKRH